MKRDIEDIKGSLPKQGVGETVRAGTDRLSGEHAQLSKENSKLYDVLIYQRDNIGKINDYVAGQQALQQQARANGDNLTPILENAKSLAHALDTTASQLRDAEARYAEGQRRLGDISSRLAAIEAENRDLRKRVADLTVENSRSQNRGMDEWPER